MTQAPAWRGIITCWLGCVIVGFACNLATPGAGNVSESCGGYSAGNSAPSSQTALSLSRQNVQLNQSKTSRLATDQSLIQIIWWSVPESTRGSAHTVDRLNQPTRSCVLRVGLVDERLFWRIGLGAGIRKAQQTRASLVSKQPFLFITSYTVAFLHAAPSHALLGWAGTVYRLFVSLYRYGRGIIDMTGGDRPNFSLSAADYSLADHLWHPTNNW